MIQADARTGIRHGFFTREGGVSGGLYASLNGGVGSNDDADQRRREPRAHGGGARRRRRTASSPSTRSIRRTSSSPTRRGPSTTRPRADAIVTRMRGARDRRHAPPIAGRSCSPIRRPASSARHMPAGAARSPASIEATVEAMERLGAARGQIRAAIGPMIRQPNYEVGPDLIARFAAEDAGSEPVLCACAARRPCPVRSRRLHRRAARAGRRRADRGSRPVHLCGSRRDFSAIRRTTHRAEADYGRHVNAIALDGA